MSSSLPLLRWLLLVPAIVGSNNAVLSRLLVAWIDDRICEYRYQQNDPFDEILTVVGDVEDRHRVKDGADKQRADHRVQDAAASSGQSDAAKHAYKNDVVDQRRVIDSRLHAVDGSRQDQPGKGTDQCRQAVLEEHYRTRRTAQR